MKNDEEALSVLMFHRANYFDMISDYPYDLVLSGHIHGGQIRIPGIMNGIINSHMGGSKYVKGEYNEYGKTLLVCGGIGLNNGVPRMFNTPEIMTVELERIEVEDEDEDEDKSTPQPTETPKVTATPQVTVAPEETDVPEPTQTPAVTKEP